jgi:outer membrane lipoprotein carrier protein
VLDSRGGFQGLLIQTLPQKMPRVACCCVAAALLAPISAPNANAIRRALEVRYRHAATLKAAFYERYSDGKSSGQAESGTVYFSRPGRMRWEYESPQQKLFIVDGKNVWFYIPADHAASRANMKESADWRTPIALLAGKADLGKLCRTIELVEAPNTSGETATSGPSGKGREDAQAASDAKPLSPGDSVLRCVPRGASDQGSSGSDDAIRDVLLETDPEARLVRVVVRQPGNLETEFRFGNWEENISIPESKFHFEPPPGVEIVDEEKLAGQLH